MKNRRTAKTIIVGAVLALLVSTGSAVAGEGFRTVEGIPAAALQDTEMAEVRGKLGLDLGLDALLGLLDLSLLTDNTILSQTGGTLGLLGLSLLNLDLGLEADGVQ